MGAINPIRQLMADLSHHFPGAEVQIDPPDQSNGPWFMDVALDDYRVVVEWQAHRGFGITANPESAFGEGADEGYRSLDEARERVLTLLSTRAPTEAAPALSLRDLRQSRRVTQSQLAERLQVRQASIAKLERRADLRLSTLADVIEAMGGDLVISARFPDGTERRLCFAGAAATSGDADR